MPRVSRPTARQDRASRRAVSAIQRPGNRPASSRHPRTPRFHASSAASTLMTGSEDPTAMNPRRTWSLQQIQQNIDTFGYHMYVVDGGAIPRFIYTIGLSPTLGAELIFAGGILYSLDEARAIIEHLRGHLLNPGSNIAADPVGLLGTFCLRAVHRSWGDALLLGAIDFYRTESVAALQCVPDEAHMTIDVPDLSTERSGNSEPAWRWLTDPWPYACAQSASATTDIAALRGAPITEVARWEEDYWEMFAGNGPDVTEDDARIVPITTLLAADPTLAPALELKIGEGFWRHSEEGEWTPWRAHGLGRD